MGRDLQARPNLSIGDVGQEKQYADLKRSDLVIWIVRDVQALAAVELKTLLTPLDDPDFQDDVIKKGRRLNAPYCAQWNQCRTVIYATPPEPPNALALKETFCDEHVVYELPEISEVTTKNYVGRPTMEVALERRARDLLTALANVRDTGAVGGRIVDPSVFVGALEKRVREIREHVATGVREKATSEADLRRGLVAWANRQGPEIEASVLYERAAAQFVYRVLGHVPRLGAGCLLPSVRGIRERTAEVRGRQEPASSSRACAALGSNQGDRL